MLYMIYSEWNKDKGCIVNFIKDEEEAIIWANCYYNQLLNTKIQYEPLIKPILFYTRDKQLNFHTYSPIYTIGNGLITCFIVSVDCEFQINELLQLKEFNADLFP